MLTNQAGVLLKCGNAVIVQLRIRVRGLLVAHPRKAKQTARPSRLLKTPRCLSRPAVSAAFLRWRARELAISLLVKKPRPLRFRHFSHAGDQFVVRILSFQSLELIQKRSTSGRRFE